MASSRSRCSVAASPRRATVEATRRLVTASMATKLSNGPGPSHHTVKVCAAAWAIRARGESVTAMTGAPFDEAWPTTSSTAASYRAMSSTTSTSCFPSHATDRTSAAVAPVACVTSGRTIESCDTKSAATPEVASLATTATRSALSSRSAAPRSVRGSIAPRLVCRFAISTASERSRGSDPTRSRRARAAAGRSRLVSSSRAASWSSRKPWKPILAARRMTVAPPVRACAAISATVPNAAVFGSFAITSATRRSAPVRSA